MVFLFGRARVERLGQNPALNIDILGTQLSQEYTEIQKKQEIILRLQSELNQVDLEFDNLQIEKEGLRTFTGEEVPVRESASQSLGSEIKTLSTRIEAAIHHLLKAKRRMSFLQTKTPFLVDFKSPQNELKG